MKPKQDIRPWGEEEIFTMNEKTTVKILTINPAERFSLQYHNRRKEFWKIIEGEAIIQIGEKSIDSMVGDEYEVGIGVKHRATGKGKPAKILEISFGDFDEKDIVRLEDDYGRK